MFATIYSIYFFILIPLLLAMLENESIHLSKATSYRLPTNIVPISYTINLSTYLNDHKFMFDGETNILIEIRDQTNDIKLHASNELKFDNITIFSKGSGSIVPSNFLIDNVTDFLTIHFENILPVGQYKLYFKYKNLAKPNITGFLHHSYRDDGNKLFWLAFTQLEPTGARKVFPCWDEPGTKANFLLIISHSTKYRAISNMHVVDNSIDKNDPNRTITYFAETPKMSTYLVGIVLFNFTYIESDDKLIRIYSRNSVVNKLKHTLKIGEETLKIMNNYTGMSYKNFGFEKLDIVVIPNIGENVAGMENWGLITVQEMSAVVEEGVTPADEKEWATKVISHECIHQWFGNLVTVNWWTDLWMNEGIATYFHFLIVDQIEKTWHIMDRFVVDKSLIYVLHNEATEHATPIKIDIKDPKKMLWSNYYHTYYKSAYLIRTVEKIIGEEKFHTVWKNYIKKKAFQAVDANDIIDEFAKVSGMPDEIFKEIFNNWLTTPGFPIVNVKRNYSTGELFIEQSRYLSLHNNISVHNERYWIPINYATEDKIDFDDVKFTHWMKPNDISLKIGGFHKNKWVILNKQQFGYYTVNYDEKNWKLIIKTLKSKNYKEIHVRNRLQLNNDAFMLIRANKLNHKVILSLMEYLEQETDLIPWIPIWKGIEYLTNYLKYTKYTEPFKTFVVKITKNIIEDLEFDESPNDTHLIKYYRANALKLACTSGSQLCLTSASVKLIKWLDSPMRIQLPPDLKSVILCSGIREVQYEVWNKLWHKWLNRPDQDVLNGLGCTSNSTSLMKLLYGIVGYDKIHHTYSLPYAINAIATGSTAGVYVAIVFMIEHWRPVIEITPPLMLKDLITNVSLCIVNDDQFYMFRDFIEMRYYKLTQHGIEPQKLMEEVLRIVRSYKRRHPVYERFFFSH